MKKDNNEITFYFIIAAFGEFKIKAKLNDIFQSVLDEFLKKKEFSDLGFKNDISLAMNVGVEDLFRKIYAENEKNYLSHFFLYIYNFERSLKIIKPRKSKKEVNNDENEIRQ